MFHHRSVRSNYTLTALYKSPIIEFSEQRPEGGVVEFDYHLIEGIDRAQLGLDKFFVSVSNLLKDTRHIQANGGTLPCHHLNL
jgi:hypothetical protein